jgi:hypothetical protein
MHGIGAYEHVRNKVLDVHNNAEATLNKISRVAPGIL